MTNGVLRGRLALLLSCGVSLLPGAAAVAGPTPPPPAPATVAAYTGLDVLSTIPWSHTGYKTKQAANDAFVVGGAKDAGDLADILVPMDRAMKLRVNGKGQGCRLRFAFYDGSPPYGAWKDKPAAVWHVNAPQLPYTFDAMPKAFFEIDPVATGGIATRKIRVAPENEKGHMCAGATSETIVTFGSTGHFESVLTRLETSPIQLAQSWPGPTTTGSGFSFTLEGAGPVEGAVDVTLEGAGFATHTAKIALTPKTANVMWPALLQGTALTAFPGLKNLPAGTHTMLATVKGADGSLLGSVKAHVHVLVAGPPPAKGATISQISSDGPGFFAGDKQGMTVNGTPGDLGTCDAFAMQISPVGGAGGGQTLALKNKKFPEDVTSAGDFTLLGDGVWRAWATPSGKLCTGTPGDALVQVETPTPNFSKDRPTLTMAKSAFVSEQAKLTIALPASYALFAAAGTPVGCCDTELYFKNKAGVWAKNGGTINRNFSDWDTDDASSFAGVLLYDEFMQTPDAVEWALRVRATATGRQFAWSNLARFTVK
jgi:hypothetical protein